MITRVGPPTAIDVKDGEFTLRVPLTESPPPEWVHFFRESPSEYTSMCHPKLIDVEGDVVVLHWSMPALHDRFEKGKGKKELLEDVISQFVGHRVLTRSVVEDDPVLREAKRLGAEVKPLGDR